MTPLVGYWLGKKIVGGVSKAIKSNRSKAVSTAGEMDDPRVAQIESMIEQLDAAGMTGQAEQLRAALSTSWSPNAIQNIGEGLLSDYSGQNRYYNSILNQAINTGSQALETLRQQRYNSEAESIARENAAGLNPDLSGIANSQAGQAAADEEVPDPNAATQTEDSSIPDLLSIGQMFSPTDILTRGLTLASTAMDFAGKSWDFRSKQITGLGAEFDSVMDTIAKLWPTTDSEIATDADAVKLEASTIEELSSGLGLSKRARRVLKSMMGKVTHDENGNPTTGLMQRIRELQSKTLSDESSIVGIMSSPGFADDLMTWAESYYKQYGVYVNRANKLLQQASSRKSELYNKYAETASQLGLSETMAQTEFDEYLNKDAQAKFGAEYWNDRDAATAANADDFEAYNRWFDAEMDKIANDMFQGLLDDINDLEISDGAKKVLRQGVHQARAQYQINAMSRKAKKLAKAGQKGVNEANMQDPLHAINAISGLVSK